MKNRASAFLKQIMTVLSTVVKAKSLAIKSKTSAIKTRLLILSLLKNKKVLATTISHKIHALIGHLDHKNQQQEEEDISKAIVLYNSQHHHYPNTYNHTTTTTSCTDLVEQDYYDNIYAGNEEDKYPDLTHCLFDDDLDYGDDQTRSVIDLVKTAKEEDGENFSLEDEIDHVADLFIKRFHRQMKMQKQESFKRYQEMLQRGL